MSLDKYGYVFAIVSIEGDYNVLDAWTSCNGMAGMSRNWIVTVMI